MEFQWSGASSETMDDCYSAPLQHCDLPITLNTRSNIHTWIQLFCQFHIQLKILFQYLASSKIVMIWICLLYPRQMTWLILISWIFLKLAKATRHLQFHSFYHSLDLMSLYVTLVFLKCLQNFWLPDSMRSIILHPSTRIPHYHEREKKCVSASVKNITLSFFVTKKEFLNFLV